MPLHTSVGVFPGKPLKGNERFAKLYHYTKFETFIKIWLSKKLKFGHISGLNDINEVWKGITVPIVEGPTPNGFRDYEELLLRANEIINSYKQISLTKNYDSYLKGCMSPMMWGQYGDKGNGVCIELEYSKIKLPADVFANNVKYINLSKMFKFNPILLFKQDLLEQNIVKHRKELFFTKTIEWKGENEFRFITKDHDYLDISSAITAIYITKLVSENTFMVEDLVNGKVPVRVLWYIEKNGERIPILPNSKTIRDQLYGV
jgi:hypothetical protein